MIKGQRVYCSLYGGSDGVITQVHGRGMTGMKGISVHIP